MIVSLCSLIKQHNNPGYLQQYNYMQQNIAIDPSLFSTSCSKGEQSTQAAAETATEQCTNRVDYQQYNEGEQIWNWHTAV